MIKIFLALITFFTQVSYGRVDFHSLAEASTTECQQDVQYLLEGQTAPCTGYLFSPKKEYEVRFNNETHQYLKDFVKKQDEINTILSKRLENAQNYNEYLGKRLRSEKRDTFWEKSLYFTLGAVLTGVIAVNVR